MESFEPSQSHDVLLINLGVDFLRVVVGGSLVEHAECQSTLTACGLLLADESLHATTLRSRFESQTALGLDQTQRVEGKAERRESPEAVALSVGVREVQHVLTRCNLILHDALVAHVGDDVGVRAEVVTAALCQPQVFRLAQFVALDVHKAVAQHQTVHRHLLPQRLRRHHGVRLHLQQIVQTGAE